MLMFYRPTGMEVDDDNKTKENEDNNTVTKDNNEVKKSTKKQLVC